MRWLFVLMFGSWMLVAAAARAQGVSLTAASEQQKKAASEAYKRGQRAFESNRLEEALAQFRASYDIVASPNPRFMVVRVLERMGKNADAYREAKELAPEAEQEAQRDARYAMTAQATRTKLTELRQAVGIVRVQVAGGSGGTLTVNGTEVPESAWTEEIAVDPGDVEVVLSTPHGRNTARATVAAGQEQSIDIAAPEPRVTSAPPSPEPGPADENGDGSTLRTLSIVSFVIGGVGAVGFAVFGALTLREEDRLEELCPNDACPPSLSDEADRGRTYQTVANISLVVGSVGLAAGVGLLVASFIEESESESDARSTQPRIAVGPGSLVVSGSF